MQSFSCDSSSHATAHSSSTALSSYEEFSFWKNIWLFNVTIFCYLDFFISPSSTLCSPLHSDISVMATHQKYFVFCFSFYLFIYSVKSSCVTTFPPLFIDSISYPLMETYSDGMKEEIQLRMNSSQYKNQKAINWDPKKKHLHIILSQSLDLQGTKWVSIVKWLSGLFCNF